MADVEGDPEGYLRRKVKAEEILVMDQFGPKDPAWHECPYRLRRVNEVFLGGE